MHGYLGTFPVESLVGTPFEGFGPKEWAMEFIGRYGQTDGAHHKLWVLDQVSRILNGTPVKVVQARWENGTKEYRISTGEPSKAYLDWVEEMKGFNEKTGEYDYSYDEGIAP